MQQEVSLFTREWIEIIIALDLYVSMAVSLFTREWIEIVALRLEVVTSCVSLFTREWIEIGCRLCLHTVQTASPSLRGSGLKFLLGR